MKIVTEPARPEFRPPDAPAIPFNRSAPLGRELEYISNALTIGQIAGDQPFAKKCQTWNCPR